MSEFVNYNKRDVTLPRGSKDLVQVLDATKRRRMIAAARAAFKAQWRKAKATGKKAL